MTIRNYTFFSPNGTEFPVTANSDAKLYMLLAGNDYSQFIIKHWSEPTLTGLNKIYADTSVLLGGRYFELNNEPVSLSANSVNYIHANIDPSNVQNPVTLSVETSINSNSNDINSGNGVIKRLIDIVTTDATKVTKSETPEQYRNFDRINSNSISVNDISLKGSLNVPTQMLTVQTGNGLQLQLTKKNNDLVIVRFLGSVANIESGKMMSGTWVDVPFRPAVPQSLIGHFAGRDTSFHIDINPNGSITWWGASIGANPITPRGNASYFIK